MKKQNLSRSLALTLIVFASLLAMPKIAQAGSTNAAGSSDDSSSYSGDTFVEFVQSTVEIAADANNNVSVVGGSLRASADTQKNMDKIGSDIRSTFQNQNNPIINLILGKGDAGTAGFQVERGLVALGVRSELAQQLRTALSGLIADGQPININQLDAAITAYNELVNNSSPQVIAQLAQNPNFKSAGQQLRELRSSLSKK